MRPGIAPEIRVAGLLTIGWFMLCGLALLLIPSGGAGPGPGLRIAAFVAVLLPVALIWLAALTAGGIGRLRDENRHLRAAVREIGRAPGEPSETDNARRSALELQVEALAQAQKKTEATLARLNSVNTRPAPSARPAERPGGPAQRRAPDRDVDQPALALVVPAPEPVPISVDEYIRALNFPMDEHDAEGFRALVLARKDHAVAGLLRSSEDVLTLLAENGIYMDDLEPDRSRPEIWRRFARGERGGMIAELGGVRDRDSLARAAGRMREDPVFRDCAHHFLRRFDQALGRFEEIATDEEIVALAETRSARAFMLLGRVSGSFD
ncbi:hypothetical protein [Tropicimonas sp.]|uniref:hypothetical protein n=1 Tax=Tropicimonas sp. TaxID=2067044 RepID=UPI003A87E590